MTRSRPLDVHAAIRRAVSRIRAWGIDGPRPIEEIEALLEHGDAVGPALSAALNEASEREVAATIHLARLLRCSEALDAVERAAYRRPSSIEAKREALETMRACGREPRQEELERLTTLERVLAGGNGELLEQIATWPDAWRRPAIESWLEGAGEAQVGSVEKLLGSAAGVDESLIDWLGAQATSEAAAVLLRYLAQATDRARLKRAKKALHKLRSKGLEVEEGAAGGKQEGFSIALDGAALDDSRAFVTSIDGQGARMIWVLARSRSGGSRLLQAVVDDTTGLREAEIAAVTRRGFRRYLARLEQNPALLVEQIDVDRALGLLYEVVERSRRNGHAVPADYGRWLDLVGRRRADRNAAPQAEIYEHVRADEVRGDEALLEASLTLLREPSFASWAADGAATAKAAEEVRRAETSTVMISDEQRREHVQDAIGDAVRASFDAEARERYRGRLEAMAAMLWKRGQRDAARQAVAAAIGFTEIDDLFHRHPFARGLVHRGVWLAYQDRRREEGAQGSRLIRP